MKVIDPRNGIELAVGQTSRYPDGESVMLLDVEPGLLSARARVRLVGRSALYTIDHQTQERGMVTIERWVPLRVRWTHPNFFLQHVGFLPS